MQNPYARADSLDQKDSRAGCVLMQDVIEQSLWISKCRDFGLHGSKEVVS